MSFVVDAEVLFALRCGSGSFVVDCDYLTAAESSVLADSYSRHRPAIRRALGSYYSARCVADIDDAIDWAESETYALVIERTIDEPRAIPTTAKHWASIARLVARRYWETLADRPEVLPEELADKLAEFSEGSSDALRSFVADCLSRTRCGARVYDYAMAYVDAPRATSDELADELGTTANNVRSLRCRFLGAMRSGYIGLLVSGQI